MNFKKHWIITLVLKLILASRLPLLGDEAYYVYWGKHPAGGYYDLPPMAGWWATLLLTVSQNPLWIRMPAILLSSVLALWVRKWAQGLATAGSVESLEADRIGLFLLWIPFLFLPVIFTTDTPFILFWIASLLAFDRATRAGAKNQSSTALLLSGFFAGLAFLSKYFALLLGPIFFLILGGLNPKHRPPLTAFLWVGLGFLPAVVQHLEWNSRNCWINLVFNLQTRHPGSVSGTFRDFAIFSLILSLPAVPLLISKQRALFFSALRAPENRVWSASFFFPIFAFAISAWNSGTGFHWLIGPFFSLYVIIARVYARASLLGAGLWQLRIHQLCSCVGLITVIAVSFLNDAFFRARLSGAHYLDYVVFRYPSEILQELSLDAPILTDSYSISAVLEAASSSGASVFGVWGSGSKFGREFDFTFTPTAWKGRDLSLFFRSEQSLSKFEPYFSTITAQKIEIRGANFYTFKGKGFRSEAFESQILAPAISSFYPPFRWPERGCPVRTSVR